MHPPIRVLVVDDQTMVRYGLRMILDNEEDVEVVGEAGDGQRALDMAAALRPDVVLMDIRMPVMDGIEATGRIRAGAGPEGTGAPAVVVLTTFDDEEYVLGSLRAGAAGFLLKDTDPDQLLAAVRQVAAGHQLLDPSVTRTLVERYLELERLAPSVFTGPRPAPGVPAGLTDRETQVLLAVARGLSNQEIAEEFGVTEATVKSHVSHLLAKLGLTSRVQAVILAYDCGLVRPERRGS